MDIASKLKSVGLGGLHQCCWPAAAAVTELATKKGQLSQAGVYKPFVMVKLADWLPQFARESHDNEGLRLPFSLA